jgi:hypothetical protein
MINNGRSIIDIAVPLNHELPTTITGINLKAWPRMVGR